MLITVSYRRCGRNLRAKLYTVITTHYLLTTPIWKRSIIMLRLELMAAYVVDADVEWFVDDDPCHRLLTTRLSQRPVVRHVVVCVRHETLDWDVSNSRLLTCALHHPPAGYSPDHAHSLRHSCIRFYVHIQQQMNSKLHLYYTALHPGDRDAMVLSVRLSVCPIRA